VSFKYRFNKSSWAALRVYPAAHTNPVFVLVDNKPVRVLQSAQWCRKTVDQCWKTKHANIPVKERAAAAKDYEYARKVYDEIIAQSKRK
jgi:hypothetical protein